MLPPHPRPPPPQCVFAAGRGAHIWGRHIWERGREEAGEKERGEDRDEPAERGPPLPPPLPAPPPRTAPPAAGSRPGPCVPEPPTARRRARRCTMAAENRSAAGGGGGGGPWGLPGESLLGGSVCRGRGGNRASPRPPLPRVAAGVGRGIAWLEGAWGGGCAPLVGPEMVGGCLSANFPSLLRPSGIPEGAPRVGTPALVHRFGMCGVVVQGCSPARAPGRGLAPPFPAPIQTNTAPQDTRSKAPRIPLTTYELALSAPCQGHMSSLHPRGQAPPQWGTQGESYLLPPLVPPLGKRFVFRAGNYLHAFFASLCIPTRAAGTRSHTFWILCPQPGQNPW